MSYSKSSLARTIMKLQYLLYMTAALSLTSCNDAFLDRESQSINDGTFWNSVNDLRTYANAFYGILPGGVTNLGDEDSDNQVPLSPNSFLWGQYTVPTEGGSWSKSNWQNIRNLNYFMTHYQQVQASEEEINPFVAEIRFFRALEYFAKIQTFGDVPWLESELNVDSEELYGPKMARNEVAKKIIEDLEFAITWLPEKGSEEDKPSHQYEFARLNLTYTVMSKRKLLQLVESKVVNGWDDPRMPTISALRRKGYTPASIRAFADRVGVAKRDNVIDLSLLEFCVREDLNKTAERRMAVLDPIKVVITNYPEGKTELFTAVNNPEDAAAGTRQVPFSRELYIERGDFMENPPKKYYRLASGAEVRLRYAYLIKCEEVIKDSEGNIVELRCTYDPQSGEGSSSDGRRVKGVIHWVSVPHAQEAEVRLYSTLFTKEDPNDIEEGKTFLDYLNPESMVIGRAFIEPALQNAQSGDKFQFERIGYFCVDPDSKPGKMVFNRTVSLKDTWAKIADK